MPSCIANSFCLILMFLVAASVASTTQAEPPEGYKLVWSDEFNDEGAPNKSTWQFERGFVRNEEHQWYQDDNARCEEGMLVIEGRREQVKNPRYDANSNRWSRRREFAEYTSASLNTRGNYEWQYGLLEVRARIEAQPGLWPAIWTLGRRGRWPSNGEVDVMEYYEHSILANACWSKPGRRGAVWDDSKRPMDKFGNDWAKDFHVYRMWWDASEIRLQVDHITLNTIDLYRVDGDTGADRNPFRQPHYLMLNLAIGGNRGGDPSGTPFPSKFLVDYARVYQQATETDTDTERANRTESSER